MQQTPLASLNWTVPSDGTLLVTLMGLAKEAAHIVSHATPRSLVVMDELGRATSTHDGIGLAWAISEQLIAIGAYTLAATHLGRLVELASVYPNCKAWHFDTGRDHLTFSWRLQPGATACAHYGLLLAPMVRTG